MAKRAKALLYALALATSPAHAFGDNIEAGLTVERSHLEQRSGVKMRATRLKIFLTEQLTPGLTLGLHGGPMLLTQHRHPDTAGMDLTGFHAGVGAQAEWFQQHAFGLTARIGYDYQQVDDSMQNRKAKLTLHTTQAELGALARLSGTRLQFGVYALHLDGDESVSGDLNSSRGIKADQPFGGFLQADFRIDWSGRISLRVDTGAQQALGLTFARQF